MTVSVVIPTYNGVRFIRDAIESVFAQTQPPDEIIVVDDQSTDDTTDVVEKIVRNSPIRMHLIRLKKNSGGPAQPTNVGISRASGDYIAVLDQDDLLVPEKIEVQSRLLRDHPDVAFAFGQIATVGTPDVIRPASQRIIEPVKHCGLPRAGWTQIPGIAALRLMLSHGTYVGGWPGFMFRRSAWEQHPLNERLRIAADREFVSRLCALGDAAHIPEIHYLRRDHGENICNQKIDMFVEEVLVSCGILRRTPELLADDLIPQQIRGTLTGLTYKLRDAGRISRAVRCKLEELRTFGPAVEPVCTIARMPLYWMWRRAVGPSAYSENL